MTSRKRKGFISYAHQDEVYSNLLIRGLKAQLKHSPIIDSHLWTDHLIPLGSHWHQVIQKEVKECDFAILLVSAHFFESEYIGAHEMAQFLQRNEENGFIFFPIYLNYCRFDQWPALAEKQMFMGKGEAYGLPAKEVITYADLVSFTSAGVPIPNAFREKYHMDLAEKLETALSPPLAREETKGQELTTSKKKEEALKKSFFQLFESKRWLSTNKIMLLGGLGILTACLYIFLGHGLLFTHKPGEFPLTIYIHGPAGVSDILDYGEVSVRLGQYRLAKEEVDDRGQVHFEGIPTTYLNDSVQLELLSRPYTILEQSAYTPQESKRITFVVQPTHLQLRGTVLNQGQRIAGAIVDFDSGTALDTTDSRGNFHLTLPKGEGDFADVSITYQGKERFRRRVTLSEKQLLTLTLDPI